MSGSTMTIAFLDGYTAKPDVMPIKTKDELSHGLMAYNQRMKNLLRSERLTIKNIRLDRAGENTSHIVEEFCISNEKNSKNQPSMPVGRGYPLRKLAQK